MKPGLFINFLYISGALLAYVTIAQNSLIVEGLLFLIILGLIMLFIYCIIHNKNHVIAGEPSENKED